jgi:hypothetical protein
MDFPTGFDAAAHAGLGRIVIMFDSAGVGCWAYLGAAGDETGETLGADLLAGWDFTSGWSLAGSATIVDSTHFNALSAPSGVYAAVIPILAVGVMYQGFIDGTTSAGSISLRQASGSGVFSSGLSITGYGISTVASTPYIKSSVASSVYISSMTIKQVLTPSETGCYTYKDAAMTTSGWNKPTAFNMNSASYTFGIYEPQSRGRLFFMGGKVSPAYGDSGYWKSESITRKRGLVCCWKVNLNTVAAVQMLFGFDVNQIGTPGANAFFVSSGTLRTYDNSAQSGVIFTPVAATDTYLAIVLRDSGAHFYAKIGTANWKYLWSTTVNNTATLYAGISNYNAVGYCDWIRQSNYLWMPKPILSDSFAGADGSADGRVSNGLGHAEVSGLGSGGSGVVWSGASGSIVSNRLVITPELGEELLTNGDMETGDPPTGWSGSNSVLSQYAEERTGGAGSKSIKIASSGVYPSAYQNITVSTSGWFVFSAYIKSDLGSVCRLGIYCNDWLYESLRIERLSWSKIGPFTTRNKYSGSVLAPNISALSATDIFYGDDVSVKQITLASCFQVCTLPTKDVTLTTRFTMQAELQAGIVFGLNETGTYFGLLYHNGAGSVVLEINENGTWTTKSTTAIAAGADAEMIIRRDDNVIWAYYGATPTLCGTGPTTTLSAGENSNLAGLKVGAFSTSNLNSFSSFTGFYTGSNGEIDILSRLIGA